MKLSIVVVNYNMCSLFKQCLISLTTASEHIDSELIIVDDASSDCSVAMLERDFAANNIMINEKSLGAAKSRNQAISQAKGEYILLVNADTITANNALDSTVAFMETHEDAAAVGVRMLSPQGRFLQVSRRGFNKAWEAFFSLTGLSKNFPKSRIYKHNTDNWVDEFETAEVDIVNGAFMLLRRSALEHVGGLDERFAQFGHDIDLSFRLRLAGFKNYYYPKTYVLNFRKQLHSKTSWSYMVSFYGSMLKFGLKYMFNIPEIKLPAVPHIFAPKYEIER